MNDHITDTELIDFIAGSLEAGRAAEISKAVASSVSLQERCEWLESVSTSLQTVVVQAADNLDSSFLTDNIMRAVTRQAVDSGRQVVSEFVSWISIIFKPVIAMCVLVTILLAAYNFVAADQHAESATTADAVLGLPQVTIASAYDVSY